MPYLTVSQAKEIRPRLNFPNDNARAEWDEAIKQAEAEDVRAGVTMLTAGAQILADQHDEFSNECIEVADGFQAVAAMAARPDSDYKAILKAYQDLEARARVLATVKESWGERVDQHNQHVANPSAFAEEKRQYWAEKSLTNRDRFLHFFPNVG